MKLATFNVDITLSVPNSFDLENATLNIPQHIGVVQADCCRVERGKVHSYCTLNAVDQYKEEATGEESMAVLTD